MVDWPDRGEPRRPTDRPASRHTTGRRPHAGSASDRVSSAIRIEEFEVLDSYQIQAASSSSDEGIHPHRPEPQPLRPHHSRSMSHPFPSLFSKKKKFSPVPVHGDTDSDNDYMSKQMKPPSRGHKNVGSVGSKDFSTGKCMTCGSLVRWPRELRIFKCTICLTINALDLPDRDARRDGSRAPAGTSETRARSEGRGAPSPEEPLHVGGAKRRISLNHTKSLVTQCLRLFLTETLGDRGRRPSINHRATLGSSSDRSPSGGGKMVSSVGTPTTVTPKTSEVSGLPIRNEPSEYFNFSNPLRNRRSMSRSQSTSYPEERPQLYDIANRAPDKSPEPPGPGSEGKRIFAPLEEYIIDCFSSFQCLNSSFATNHHTHRVHPSRDGGPQRRREPRKDLQPQIQHADYSIAELDPKLLLLGDFAENGAWWTGRQEDLVPGRTPSGRTEYGRSIVTARNPHINWAEVEEWYTVVVDTARSWPEIYNSLVGEDPTLAVPPATLEGVEAQILTGQDHVQKVVLKSCEMIMKRPGRLLAQANDLRFLLIISANPLLHADYKPYTGEFEHLDGAVPLHDSPKSRGMDSVSSRHSGIIKRIVGLLSNSSPECHNHLVQWLVRYPKSRFIQLKDLVAGLLTYRLLRQTEKKHEAKIDITDGLIPNMGAGRSPAYLHAALGQAPGVGKKQGEKEKKIICQDDWQIRAAAQVLGFLFAANNSIHRQRDTTGRADDGVPVNKERNRSPRQFVANSDFYATLLDDLDLVADFEAWERKQGKFSFCQYPFLLSVGAKIQILEHDARRQMENRAREAFFDSLITHRAIQQHLILNVRRDCLVDDSLKAVSEVIGGGTEDIKKGLRITFRGEEGIDAGGLRKEWFLLLVREVFNPDYGMFARSLTMPY